MCNPGYCQLYDIYLSICRAECCASCCNLLTHVIVSRQPKGGYSHHTQPQKFIFKSDHIEFKISIWWCNVMFIKLLSHCFFLFDFLYQHLKHAQLLSYPMKSYVWRIWPMQSMEINRNVPYFEGMTGKYQPLGWVLKRSTRGSAEGWTFKNLTPRVGISLSCFSMEWIFFSHSI